MPAVKTSLIIGGGIGGLTAGIALAQKGIDVDLVELQPNLTVYGVGIIQPNNTLRALAKVGLAEACVEVGAPFPGWRIFDATGNHIMDALGTREANPRFPENNGITRPKLHKILADAALADGVKLHFGLTVESFDDDGNGVTVTFTDGGRKCYDFVIACDGNNSTMRSRLFPGAPKPKFTGQGVWRYNLPRPADMEWASLFFGPDTKVGLVPMARDLMYLFIVSEEPGNPRLQGERLAEMMRDRLKAYSSGPVAALRTQIKQSTEVIYRPMEAGFVPGPWYKGRILMIGDACHGSTPHLAQGAAMAIEDAVLLGELLGNRASLNSTLEEFMKRRFDRCKYVFESSIQIGEWEMEEWRGIKNPKANPGGLLHDATHAMMKDF